MRENTDAQVTLRFFGIPKILPYLKPYRGMMLGMVLLGGLTTGIDAIYPLFTRYALDHFVGGMTLAGLSAFLAVYAGLLIFQTYINYKSTFMCGHLEMAVDRDLRKTAFEHLQTLSFSYFNRNSVGYIHARVISDTGLIGDLVSWQLMNLVWSGCYLISVLAVMLVIDARLAGMILLMLPAAALLMRHFQRQLLAFNRRIRELNARITGNFNEGISGARTIKVLVAEDTMTENFSADTRKMKSEAIREAHTSALFISTVTLMSSLVLALVLWQGGRLTAAGAMRLGTLSVFMSYALEMLEPVQRIIETLAAFTAIQVNIERLTKLLAEESDVADTPEVLEKYGDSFHPKKENWEALHGDVEFKDVTFTYPDGDEPVLEHFTLKVPQGANVAIVGETGAGKSTLVNLICRFYEPTGGAVLIDGRDVRERSQLWLHSHIGYVLQTPHLFSGTVRENLRYGRPEATDEDIRRALALVAADGIVDSLPQGLDSQVGEGGSMLSTGQKQLLSFARALLADPAILVLDEATASVDTVTEKAIQQAIRTVIRGRTSFVIAHRLSTITDADVILVVRDGRLIERGTHASLMQQRGYYYRLYSRQYEELVWKEAT